MARPAKRRRVCSLPQSDTFGPLGANAGKRTKINMTVDEYEAIRLIDLEGFTQEECAAKMNVARTTVQGIYISARKKLAQSLVEGNTLFIDGGSYHLCDGNSDSCTRGCHKHGGGGGGGGGRGFGHPSKRGE